jgi:hypothetical protein
MNYDNYEFKIVEEHTVELQGWPEGVVRNPGKLGGRMKVVALLTAILDGSCRWVALNEHELEERVRSNQEKVARGEIIYKPRKKASRPSRRRKSSSARSTALVNDEEQMEVDKEEGRTAEKEPGQTLA